MKIGLSCSGYARIRPVSLQEYSIRYKLCMLNRPEVCTKKMQIGLRIHLSVKSLRAAP